MENKSSNIWKNESNFDNWELRRHRFTSEMLPIFYQYMRLKSNYIILDMGCGTGVFTRYLARGLDSGKITGIDISPALINFAKKKAEEEHLTDKVNFLVEDGYNLSFESNSFDAVTGHTYLGVLSDPEKGLKEMIRVCKPGGVVSVAIATNEINNAGWPGDYPFEGNDRLIELDKKQDRIYKIYNKKRLKELNIGSDKWPILRFPKLFTYCGLENVSIYSFSHCFSYSDSRWSLEYRREQIERGLANYANWIRGRSRIPELYEAGMTREEFDELLELIEKKRRYLLNNLEKDESWEWTAGLSFIVVGNKPL